MKEIELQDRKRLLIDLLNYITDFSKKNNVRCYLHAGTLLGAVRHGGFIPWDDDIDVSMPRPDYEKFKNIFLPNKSNYYIADYSNMRYYPVPFSKLCIKNTDCIINNKKCGYGLGIDIFPIDGFPDNEKLRNEWFENHKKFFFQKYLSNVQFELYGYQGRNIIRYLIKKVKNLCYNSNKAAKIVNYSAQKNVFEGSKYAGCSVGIYRSKIELAKRESFDYGIPMVFEGNEYLVPNGYDDILRSIYGNDYMTPPTEDKRNTTHEETYYWLD